MTHVSRCCDFHAQSRFLRIGNSTKCLTNCCRERSLEVGDINTSIDIRRSDMELEFDSTSHEYIVESSSTNDDCDK